MNKTLKRLMLTICVFSPLSQAASFDCAKAATAIEKQICADAAVSKLDEQLAEVYKNALSISLDKDTLKLSQRNWLKSMRSDCPSVKCLATVYTERLQALAHNVDIDCGEYLPVAEEMICSEVQISQLNEELGRNYKAALGNLKQEEADALRLLQQQWFKTTKARCTNKSCLEEAFNAQIALVKEKGKVNLPPIQRPNFTITDGENQELCQEYLKVINRIPINEIQNCALPDLTGSPIQAVIFKPLTGDALKAMDKIIYANTEDNSIMSWEKSWPTRQDEYATGYRHLGESYWDLDKDDVADQIVEVQRPFERCTPYGNSDLDTERKLNDQKWLTMTKNEKLASAQKYGFYKWYYLIRGEQFSYVDAASYVDFKNKKYSIDQLSLHLRAVSEKWGDKNWIQIAGVKAERSDKSRKYKMTPTDCKFWLN
jgi:uncharacterized protein